MRTALAQAGLAQDPHTTAATCSMLGPGRFLEYDRGRRPPTKKYYPEPHHPMFHFCASGFLGEQETKITNMELNWLYSALIAKWPIDPTHL
jgi:hypothetical protein